MYLLLLICCQYYALYKVSQDLDFSLKKSDQKLDWPILLIVKENDQ